jgi:SpoVK/Ycf46/Vps4 family AAA+-type ATPase
MEHIRPVSWNKEAFNRLVLKSKKKELIKALVTVHLTTKQNADVIEDKGNGLIILLHGSPGTGKTLTAESVAEIAEKPLYRVTCGDIGTDAESVEKYLESVLLIGTIWECVVLLDEADVFLEERQVTDLARNALVSVFLRVLEYYDGILILTSNRVGTFDEAFKSRVQLAVHYPALDEDGRFEIWRNFVSTLKDKNVEMDFKELNQKIPLLARNKLNGRQIRNLVWTAAQLAKFKKERLEYAHLEQVIEIANEFEDYLEKTHGHTDEEYAQAQGTRTS